MDHFFTPTRRYQDLLEEDRDDDDDDDPFEYTELELAVPLEDFLSYIWHWKDLLAFVTGGVMRKILWITEKAFLVIEDDENRFDFNENTFERFIDAEIQAMSSQDQTLTLALLCDGALPTGEVGVFWRAVATSHSVKLTIATAHDYRSVGLPSGPILSQFFRGSPSLQYLKFHGLRFEEGHCRALATLQRTDLTVELTCCAIEPQDAQDIFIEWFRHNQVVTTMEHCEIDSSFLSALSGNNSVKNLIFGAFTSELLGEEYIRSLAQALPDNTGIKHLSLGYDEMSDDVWSLFFRSISRHPRVEFLSLPKYRPNYRLAGRPQPLSAASKTTRMNAILQMLQHNTVLHTIKLPDAFETEELYQNSILPRLEMNRSCFEVQRQAVKRAGPSVHPQLLGRALYVVQYNPNLVFHFLLENVPAFVRKEEEESDSAIPMENAPIAAVSGQKRPLTP